MIGTDVGMKGSLVVTPKKVCSPWWEKRQKTRKPLCLVPIASYFGCYQERKWNWQLCQSYGNHEAGGWDVPENGEEKDEKGVVLDGLIEPGADDLWASS